MNNFYKKKALKKVAFVFLMVFIYVLGSNLEIPGIHTEDTSKISSSVLFGLSMTGLSLNKLSIFSLGLGPWMSSQIIWRILSMTKVFNIQNLTNSQAYKLKYIFSLVMGVVQSLSLLLQYQVIKSNELGLSSWFIILILLTGLSFLIWLGNMNTDYGLGGPTIIIIVSMVRTGIWQLGRNISFGSFHLIGYIVLCFFIICISYIMVSFSQGELRLPLKHVMLDDKYLSESYMPIPTNPAGGMPLMYVFSIILLPQYFVFILSMIVSKNTVLKRIYDAIQLNQLPGVFLLIVFLVLLTYGFAYVNIDYKEIAENLKKGGDYFDNVYPGKNTEHYLFDKITRMATLSALFNILIIGVPMLLSLYVKSIGAWVQFLSSWLIMIILIQEIKKDFSNYYHRNDYQVFIKGEKR